MKLSNSLFAQAVAWIYENTEVKDQKTLASVTGITETTISRILNDKVKKPSKETLMRLNDAFEGVFNLTYFTGASVVLLNADAAYFKAHPEQSPFYEAIVPVPSGAGEHIPSWADSLIHRVSENTVALESMRRENEQLRAEISQLRADLGAALQALRHHPATYETIHESIPLPLAAESSNNK